MNKVQLLEELHNKALKLRKVERVITSSQFASIEITDGVIKEVQELNCDALIARVKARAEKEYGEMTVRELRDLGRSRGIYNYSRKPKWLLIKEIMQCVTHIMD